MMHAEIDRPSGEREIISLGSQNYAWSEMDVNSYRARVFGHLVRLAAPRIEHYRSDLFYDAQWLTAHMDSIMPFAFYWSCDETGTHIGTDRDLVIGRESAWHARVEVCERGRVTLTLTRIK